MDIRKEDLQKIGQRLQRIYLGLVEKNDPVLDRFRAAYEERVRYINGCRDRAMDDKEEADGEVRTLLAAYRWGIRTDRADPIDPIPVDEAFHVKVLTGFEVLSYYAASGLFEVAEWDGVIDPTDEQLEGHLRKAMDIYVTNRACSRSSDPW